MPLGCEIGAYLRYYSWSPFAYMVSLGRLMRICIGIGVVYESLKDLIAKEEVKYGVGVLDADMRRQISFSTRWVAENWEGVKMKQIPLFWKELAWFFRRFRVYRNMINIIGGPYRHCMV